MQTAQEIAKKGQLVSQIIPTKTFPLMTWSRIKNEGNLRVYIEGDGLGYIKRSVPSSNPTPVNPVALSLASVDPSQNILYVARPCQYFPKRLPPPCDFRYWTIGRFAPEVIHSINKTISIMKKSSEQKIELIGFSGGAAIAVILAALRKDIVALRTVAGVLNAQEFTQFFGDAPLSLSWDPINFAERTAHIPQIHFSGKLDQTIPGSLAESFRGKLKNKKCFKKKILENADHQSGWASQWRKLLSIKLDCDGNKS